MTRRTLLICAVVLILASCGELDGPSERLDSARVSSIHSHFLIWTSGAPQSVNMCVIGAEDPAVVSVILVPHALDAHEWRRRGPPDEYALGSLSLYKERRISRAQRARLDREFIRALAVQDWKRSRDPHVRMLEEPVDWPGETTARGGVWVGRVHLDDGSMDMAAVGVPLFSPLAGWPAESSASGLLAALVGAGVVDNDGDLVLGPDNVPDPAAVKPWIELGLRINKQTGSTPLACVASAAWPDRTLWSKICLEGSPEKAGFFQVCRLSSRADPSLGDLAALVLELDRDEEMAQATVSLFSRFPPDRVLNETRITSLLAKEFPKTGAVVATWMVATNGDRRAFEYLVRQVHARQGALSEALESACLFSIGGLPVDQPAGDGRRSAWRAYLDPPSAFRFDPARGKFVRLR